MNESEELEPILKRFFRGEAPATWPPPPQPGRATILLRRTDALSRSRFALAASLAALLIGGWLLSGRLSAPPGRPASFDDTTATRPPEMRLPK